MPVPETRREPSDKRQAILDAALDLFAERGFHGTAVPLVAERAGVGAGTLYRYFESKEALVNALYRHWKGALATALLEGFPLDRPPRAQFSEAWRRLASFAVENPKAFVFLELHHHAPYLDGESRSYDARVLVPFATFVTQAQRDLVLKDLRPELLMAIVWGALVGILRAVEAGYIPTADFAKALEEAEPVLWEAVRR